MRDAAGGTAERAVAAPSTDGSAANATPPPAVLVLTTFPERAAAEALARELLAARIAACIRIGATVQSLYHWRGEIETAAEIPITIKTRSRLYPRVEATIRRHHPYELPEIVAVPISYGLPAYLDWIAAATDAPA